MDILQVPASALSHHGRGWALYIVNNGIAELRPVKTGQRRSISTQRLSGINPDDLVINHPVVEYGQEIER